MTNCRCDPFTGDECQACKNKMLVDKAEYERLKRLEAAAIAYRHAYIEVEENEPEALQALFMSAREAEKAQKQ